LERLEALEALDALEALGELEALGRESTGDLRMARLNPPLP
jgi:hypothetical protein